MLGQRRRNSVTDRQNSSMLRLKVGVTCGSPIVPESQNPHTKVQSVESVVNLLNPAGTSLCGSPRHILCWTVVRMSCALSSCARMEMNEG